MIGLAIASVWAQGFVWLMVAFAIIAPTGPQSDERSLFRLVVFGVCVAMIANVMNWLYDPSFLYDMKPGALPRWIGLRCLSAFSGLFAFAWTFRYGRKAGGNVG